MSRRTMLAALSLAALAGCGGGRTPAGQPPLRSLTAQNVAEVREAFNAARADTRVLVLLSPT